MVAMQKKNTKITCKTLTFFLPPHSPILHSSGWCSRTKSLKVIKSFWNAWAAIATVSGRKSHCLYTFMAVATTLEHNFHKYLVTPSYPHAGYKMISRFSSAMPVSMFNWWMSDSNLRSWGIFDVMSRIDI